MKKEEEKFGGGQGGVRVGERKANVPQTHHPDHAGPALYSLQQPPQRRALRRRVSTRLSRARRRRVRSHCCATSPATAPPVAVPAPPLARGTGGATAVKRGCPNPCSAPSV